MTKFKKAYGEIENVSDRKYFTNSMHVPVWKQMSPFNKIDIESELTGYSSGGCITYVEVDENAARNETVVEQIIDYEMKEKDIPYAAVNLPNKTCRNCGYSGKMTGVNGDVCPTCGSSEIDELGRITGYLFGTVNQANAGKQDEFKDRVDHTDSLVGWARH